MQFDKEIFDLIQKEYNRQEQGLELIASENFTSEQVMRAMGNITVSYTHLDVYKRQALLTALASFQPDAQIIPACIIGY